MNAPSDMLPSVEDVVPHRPPMLLLDRLVAWDGERVLCEVRIGEGTRFLAADAMVPAVVGLEYMAQAVAAFAGLKARAAGGEPRLGFLIGCRELLLGTDGFRPGDVLEIEAKHVWGETEVGSFACQVRRAGAVLVTGALTVYQGALPDAAEARESS